MIINDHILNKWISLFSFCPINYITMYCIVMVVPGNGELGFVSGENALETAFTSKEGSRRENYPISERGGSDEK